MLHAAIYMHMNCWHWLFLYPAFPPIDILFLHSFIQLTSRGSFLALPCARKVHPCQKQRTSVLTLNRVCPVCSTPALSLSLAAFSASSLFSLHFPDRRPVCLLFPFPPFLSSVHPSTHSSFSLPSSLTLNSMNQSTIQQPTSQPANYQLCRRCIFPCFGELLLFPLFRPLCTSAPFARAIIPLLPPFRLPSFFLKLLL